MRKILSILLIIIIVINLTACQSNTSNKGNNSFSEINEENLSEIQILDEVLLDNILLENNLKETTYNDNYLFETQINENIIAESYLLEIYVSSYEMEYILNQLPIEVLEYDIDWESVIEKFAIGTTILVTVGIITFASSGTSLCYFFAEAFHNVVKEALIGSVVGAVANTLLQSENLDDLKTNAKKYVIEGAADGYMWGAISGATIEILTGSSRKMPSQVYRKDGSVYGNVNVNNQLYDNDNLFLGYLIATEENIYLADDLGNVIGMLDNSGHILDDVVKVCDKNISKINKYGRYSSKFKVDGDSVISGNEEIGILNKTTGEIVTKDGQLVGRIDSNCNLRSNNFRAIKKGVKFDRQGKIVSTIIPDDSSIVIKEAIKVADYYDLEGNKVAYSVKSICGDGVERNFLMSVDDSILGILEDSRHIATDWNSQMSQLSANGVKNAKDIIIDMISRDVDFDYGPSFSDEIIQYIKANKKLPDGLLQGHHINNVAQYPWLADNPDNIIFYTKEDHLLYGHKGNFQNNSQGELTGITSFFTKGGTE